MISDSTLRIEPNTIVQCEDIELLKRLDPEYVDLIYYDPPYFSSEGGFPLEFFNNESFANEQEAANLIHSKRNERRRSYYLHLWHRLLEIKRILKNSGRLIVRSEPFRSHIIKLFVDHLFGEESYLTEIVWPRPVISTNWTGPNHDILFIFSYTNNFSLNPQFKPIPEETVKSRYSLKDNKGPYMVTPLFTPSQGRGFNYEWRGYKPDKDKSWRFSRETLQQFYNEGQIEMPKSATGLPKLKRYLSESKGIPVGTVWDDCKTSVELFKRLLQMCSNPGDLILTLNDEKSELLFTAEASSRKWIGHHIGEDQFESVMVKMKKIIKQKPSEAFLTISLKELIQKYPIVSNILQEEIDLPNLSEQIDNIPRFVLGKRPNLEEKRLNEFKEIKGEKPLNAIKNKADEYVVAFLNSDNNREGRIYWGLRDKDGVVVGVDLTFQERNDLRTTVSNKLANIQPMIDASMYKIFLHPIYVKVSGDETINDKFVVEISVPPTFGRDPYYTEGGKLYVKTDGGIKNLTGPAMTDWIRQRLESTQL